jgi:hypothetical protein
MGTVFTRAHDYTPEEQEKAARSHLTPAVCSTLSPSGEHEDCYARGTAEGTE